MTLGLFTTADWLRADNNPGYGPLPIPQSRDHKITELVLKWAALSEPERGAVARTIADDQRSTLMAYSERMASLAVRERRPELVTIGLLALGLDGWANDWRENVLILALHYDAARRLSGDIEKLFADASTLLPDRPANAMRSFLDRDPADKSLEAMGYLAGRDSDGFRYERTW